MSQHRQPGRRLNARNRPVALTHRANSANP